jgi:TolB-like protein
MPAQALAREAALAGVEADSDTIAVSAFSNIGSMHLGPLGKGLAAMLVTDLAKVPGLQVVDRMALQALLEELKLGTSGLVDRTTAPQVGRLLKVRRVATGSLSDVEETQLQIASVLFDAERNADIGGQDVEGDLDSFFVLQKQIACGIITAMGKNCDARPAPFISRIQPAGRRLSLSPRGWINSTTTSTTKPGPVFKKPCRKIPISSWPATPWRPRRPAPCCSGVHFPDRVQHRGHRRDADRRRFSHDQRRRPGYDHLAGRRRGGCRRRAP